MRISTPEVSTSTVRYGTVRYGTVRYGTVRFILFSEKFSSREQELFSKNKRKRTIPVETSQSDIRLKYQKMTKNQSGMGGGALGYIYQGPDRFALLPAFPAPL